LRSAALSAASGFGVGFSFLARGVRSDFAGGFRRDSALGFGVLGDGIEYLF
jgi:hypothetical protein